MRCRHCGAKLRERNGAGRYRYERADTPDTAILGSGSECPENERGHVPGEECEPCAGLGGREVNVGTHCETWDDCPYCGGTGIVPEPSSNSPEGVPTP